MNYKTAAAVPVLGRLPLVEQTINRLKYVNKIDHIVCVCSNEQDELFCKKLPCDVIQHPNKPLAAKWNAGWEYLMSQYSPDYYVFVGSSDWLSENWLDVCIPLLKKYDAVGKLDMYLFDLGEQENRLCYWPGYIGVRSGDTIGIGRVLTKQLVEKMNGRPFRDDLDNCLDWSMTEQIKHLKGKLHTIEGDEIKSLSLSCYLWNNKHHFAHHWDGVLPSSRIDLHKEFMCEYFPEHLNLKL